jgi:hypothetical protein
MIEGTIWLWVGFNVFVLAMLALDLGVFHRQAHAVSMKGGNLECGLDKPGFDLQYRALLCLG